MSKKDQPDLQPVQKGEIPVTPEGLEPYFEGDPKANAEKILAFLPSLKDDPETEADSN